jgi:hypothetical protein
MFTLDHGIVFVRDLGIAAAAYRRLGFWLTPRGDHTRLGTANHTIMLDRDYLELLTIVTPGPENAQWEKAQPGLVAAALGTKDARGARQALLERGIECPPVVDFERAVALPSGPVAARFSVCHLPEDASPAIPAFFCQHHTPEYVWRPEFQRHPNSAAGLVGMTVCHRQPETLSAAYGRLLGTASVHPHPGGIELDLKNTKIWVVSPEYARARLARRLDLPTSGTRPLAVTIRVRDPLTTRRVLSANGIPFRPFGRRSIIIEPTWTNGVYLEFLSG